MAEGPSRKRGFPGEDFDSGKQPPQKRVRFPKGKKAKSEDYVMDEEAIPSLKPQRAADERKKLRSEFVEGLIEDVGNGLLPDITKAEVQYHEGSETFEDDGIKIEPFNLTKEREEGYFDSSGNYVEFINEDEIKDAWFDGVEANKSYASGVVSKQVFEVKGSGDLSSAEIAKMKKRIADSLESGETVLRALKRLKGNSTDRKAKMSAETKEIFDQLTEDAMRLMENGEYNVYDEEQETFQREAEGYEKLADLDIFGDDDDKPAEAPVSNGAGQLSGDQQDDYVYDESTGYYYSSNLGYYYDPASGLYCYAVSGQWFSYNAETGSYDEVQPSAPSVSEPAASSAAV